MELTEKHGSCRFRCFVAGQNWRLAEPKAAADRRNATHRIKNGASGVYLSRAEESKMKIPVKSGHYEDITLAEWMAHTPHLLVNQHLQVGEAMIDAIPKREMVITPA